MGIDRGTLSRIDRKLLAGLQTDEEWRVARLPVSDALWSAWKRYCSAIGISMGRGLAALIQRELESVVGTEAATDLLVTIETQLTNQRGELAERERRLAGRELSIARREQFLEIADRFATPARVHTVGRNDRCPCGSGVKYKRCHGAP
jgi:uncharacterized protein YecA (UPF0149 family)